MTNGIDVADLKKRFGVDLSEKYSLELEELIESDLIEWTSDHLRLTSKGMLYSNEVFRVFV
jgi:coproporphyrinogen III oxidase-like Fe-S oxidoreductase